MKIRKNVSKLSVDRKNFALTPWGSLIESCLKVTGKKLTDGQYMKLLKKAKFPYLDDGEFLPKTFEAMGFDIADFKGVTIGLYKDDIGTSLFYPVAPLTVTGDDGEKEIIAPVPIFDDFIPQTVARNIGNVELIRL